MASSTGEAPRLFWSYFRRCDCVVSSCLGRAAVACTRALATHIYCDTASQQMYEFEVTSDSFLGVLSQCWRMAQAGMPHVMLFAPHLFDQHFHPDQIVANHFLKCQARDIKALHCYFRLNSTYLMFVLSHPPGAISTLQGRGSMTGLAIRCAFGLGCHEGVFVG